MQFWWFSKTISTKLFNSFEEAATNESLDAFLKEKYVCGTQSRVREVNLRLFMSFRMRGLAVEHLTKIQFVTL